MLGMLNFNLIVGVVSVIGVLGVLLFIKKSYIKAPPDTAYIISGIRDKIIIGKSSIVLPIVERVDELHLGLISVDVKNEKSPTYDYIEVDIDGVVKLEIDTSEEGMKLASKNFLNDNKEDIAEKVIEVLEGNMREITGQMDIADMIQDRKTFGEKVQENAAPDMKKMGLEIVAFNIQSIKDRAEIIESLGAENTEQIKKNATIAKAKAQEEIRISQAESDNKAHEAETNNQLLIAQRDNSLKIDKAKLLAESSKEESIATSVKSIEDAKQKLLIQGERSKVEKFDALLAVELETQRLAAEEKAKADANQYVRVEEAKANKAIKLLEAEAFKESKLAEAEAIKTLGEAEAGKIKAVAVAEAEGILKKAEAMQQYGEAAITEMIINKLPEIVAASAKPLENIDKITMYGEGNVSKLTEDITKGSNQLMNGVFDGVGIDLKSILGGFLGAKTAIGSEDRKDLALVAQEIMAGVKTTETEEQIKE